MTFKQGLLSARSHIIFLLGVSAAFALMYYLEKWDIQKKLEQQIRQGLAIEQSKDIPTVSPRELTAEEKQWAGVAWLYFENNYHTETGLVNSVDNYPASTMWDTASYLMALISARRLDIVNPEIFDARLSLCLKTLGTIPLCKGRLPNKSYNTITGEMTDYNNKKSEHGIGWSAIDMGRILAVFHIIVWNYPEHAKAVKEIIKQWDLDAMLHNGLLYGAVVDAQGNAESLQEGRLGYEEYAAKALYLMGMDVYRALRYTDFLEFADIYGVKVPYDLRDAATYGAHNYVLSESYILDGIEFGWDETSREFAFRIYKAQEERWRKTGILTAVSEDHIDQPPYFVYNTVFTNGKPWNCITSEGEDASKFRNLSTKAAFGWYALYGTDYSKKLIEHIKDLYDPNKGWYSGRYESPDVPNRSVTCNTNAIILESLCFIKLGRHVTLYD